MMVIIASSTVVPAKAGTHLAAFPMFYVYLLASQPHGTLYAGMTDDLVRRIGEHKASAVPGFTAKYQFDRLVWFEAHDRRAWKIQLIEDDNPYWIDLYSSLSP
jgi:putative endonuclease